ncbi:transcription termination factor 3, mitochondrial [Leptopilina heterotoma]|uniref:transcription termination factor 3, mitochondrial n=1 Tax=Leptopilina heterotoma TaxID=63436 RepID=UPI001CA91823|nr:transcription termination factor 3, mitochondrial [Leptopilina heterotoma]
MVLLKPFFVQIARKVDLCLKSEVIFRQCSSISSINKQISEKQESPRITFVPKEIDDNLPERTEINSFFKINRDNFYDDDYLHGFEVKLPKALDENTEDVSHLSTETGASFNIASFADKSKTVQELTKLGVELWKFDKHLEIVKMIVNLNFDKDVKPYIQFLHDTGLPVHQFGPFITKFPKIFQEDLDDLHTRIRYLRAHNYKPSMIATILEKHPLWLSYTTQEIDSKLGYFQNEFKLKANNVRLLTLKLPKLISYDKMVLEKKTFAFKKEFGFEPEQAALILLSSPRLWTKCLKNLRNSFDYAHNTMCLSHEILSLQPCILNCRKSRLEARHQFLVHIKKAQYDPLKPLYVSPKDIVSGTDSEFCANIAKTTILTYNDFLKTL